MKTKLFIGSSVEGLAIAYAAQQNLDLDAEVTVWSQGIFNLSSSILDSLIQVLNRTDFGLFVFTPDDIVTMRGEQTKAVRDNVLFELGLFIGRLGKARSFILLPRGQKDFHLPTDLIGVTPGEYEANRADENVQAATGPVCHQIREAIKKLGSLSTQNNSSPQNLQANEKTIESDSNPKPEARVKDEYQPKTITDDKDSPQSTNHWLDAYNNEEYDKALSLLEKKMETGEEKDALYGRTWIGQIMEKKEPGSGLKYIEEVKAEYPKSFMPYVFSAFIHSDNDLFHEALVVLEEGLRMGVDKPEELKFTKAATLERLGDLNGTIKLLDQITTEAPKYYLSYISLADLLVKQGKKDEARNVYENGLKIIPNNEELLYEYGVFLSNSGDNSAALEVFRKLTKLSPNDSRCFGYLGNIYLRLGFYGLSLEAYETANKLEGEKASWIIGNIGNIFNGKGFYPKAIEYLKKSIELDPDSDYAHGRLAEAIKSLKEEQKKANEVIEEYRQSKKQEKVSTENETISTGLLTEE